MSSTTFPNGEVLTSTAMTPTQIEAGMQPLVASIFGIDPVADPAVADNAVRIAWQTSGQPAWAITEDVCIIAARTEDAEYSRLRDQLYQPNNDTSLLAQMDYTQCWRVHFTLYGPNCADHARLLVSAMVLDWVSDWLAGLSTITAIAPHAAGTSYIVGDVVLVEQSGAYGGYATVTAIGSSGAVTALAPVTAPNKPDIVPGVNYETATNLLTSGGTGTGLTVDITVARNATYVVAEWNRPEYVPESFQGRWWQRADVYFRFYELVLESLAVPTAASVDVTIDTDTGYSQTFEISAT